MAYPSHYVLLQQNKKGLNEVINRTDSLAKSGRDSIQVGAIEIIEHDSSCELRYRYDLHKAIPERHKYCVKTSMYVPLNELAMQLLPGEYGRVVYNGRYVDYDTGNWYYNTSIHNVVFLDGSKAPRNIFITREPSKLYKQVAYLR